MNWRVRCAQVFVKQGYRDGCDTVCEAPDDAFANQAGANGRLRADRFQQLIGDVPGAVWFRTQVCLGTQIPAFTGCGSFQPYFEETFIKSGDGKLGCGLHDIQSDRTGGGHISGVCPTPAKNKDNLGFFPQWSTLHRRCSSRLVVVRVCAMHPLLHLC